ncbi:Pentatricopeptide repeat [Macleaya cordata]|uniref:Pentatricopeptide repeat n=1 Tax=Macleaya cordata TaxID=56857 RepID=A0A200PSS2_MACCD|nr:Pentatricopeptide repeat [Macleaya cordata]
MKLLRLSFEKMAKFSLKPELSDFNTPIGWKKRLNEALEIFQRSKAINGSSPEIPTYNAVVGSYCWPMRSYDAYRVVEEMRRNGGKGVLRSMHMLSALISSLCKYFQEMLDLGIRPPDQLYSNLKQALINAAKKDVALDLGLKLDKIGKTPLIR